MKQHSINQSIKKIKINQKYIVISFGEQLRLLSARFIICPCEVCISHLTRNDHERDLPIFIKPLTCPGLSETENRQQQNTHRQESDINPNEHECTSVKRGQKYKHCNICRADGQSFLKLPNKLQRYIMYSVPVKPASRASILLEIKL